MHSATEVDRHSEPLRVFEASNVEYYVVVWRPSDLLVVVLDFSKRYEIKRHASLPGEVQAMRTSVNGEESPGLNQSSPQFVKLVPIAQVHTDVHIQRGPIYPSSEDVVQKNVASECATNEVLDALLGGGVVRLLEYLQQE
ncbi:hypothetical protein ACTJKQ_22345 [Acidovorax sp. 22279]|uniref:hypothetical protein n=1 Tax=Acidovorax sp. 22279 TaxID=3453900 RepID=UPI003F86D9D9